MKKKLYKDYIQCGYEDECVKKDCLNCQKKRKHTMNMTLAEEIAVEDFATCDIPAMMTEPTHEGELELLQNVMRKLMTKMFKSEEKVKWEK